MKLLSGILGLTLTSALALASANAADMYVPVAPGGYKDGPVYGVNWSGFYVGVNGGYGWNGSTDTWTATFLGTPFASGAGAEPRGGFGGGQIGYNWQRDHLVFGLETDIQGAGISDDKEVITSIGLPVHNVTNVDWFGTFRGRLGYAFGQALVYATGGLAYGSVSNEVNVPAIGLGTVLKRDQTETGYVVGGGVEYKFTPAWSVKGEYQYIDFGSQKMAGVGVFAPFLGSKEIDTSINTIRLGLNYHIHQDYVPLK
jgi:outer membrane immunogenic protein